MLARAYRISPYWRLIVPQVFISNIVLIRNSSLTNREAGLSHDIEVDQLCEVRLGSNVWGGVKIGN